ncbi:MAG TPA: protein kinase, partial [Labilithrix sp.]
RLAEKLPVPVGGLVDGKYRVDGVLGVGGMGCVVEATHLGLLHKVAIKFIHATEAEDREHATRLLREARAARALTSDHVARALDVGTLPSGAPYLVMEHLVGQTLQARLQRGRVGVNELAVVCAQTCEALAEAHAKGIVHRDIKPSNLFLVDKGPGHVFVKVLDFGISRVKNNEIAVESNLTGSASMLGTPRFMAPEQMTSTKSVDARADIWAIGICMYYALTQRYPFEAETLIDLGIKVVSTDAPSILEARPDLDVVTAAIVRRCLRRDPGERYASAEELRAELLGLVKTKTTIVMTPAEPRSLTATVGGAAMPVPPRDVPGAQRATRASVVALAGIGALGLAIIALAGVVAARRMTTTPAVSAAPEPLSVAASESVAPTAVASVEPTPLPSVSIAASATVPSPHAATPSSSPPRAGTAARAPRSAPPARTAPRSPPTAAAAVVTAAPDER